MSAKEGGNWCFFPHVWPSCGSKQCVSLVVQAQLVLRPFPTIQRHTQSINWRLDSWLSLYIGCVHVKLVTCPKSNPAFSPGQLEKSPDPRTASTWEQDRQRQTMHLWTKCHRLVVKMATNAVTPLRFLQRRQFLCCLSSVVGVCKCQVLFPWTCNNCVILMCHIPVSSW